MQYSVHVDIDLPIDRVIELFDNPDNMKYWQPGLQSFTHLSGEPGQPGAKSRLHYIMGKREIEMIETIHTHDLPDRMSGTYETKGVYNEVTIAFEVLNEHKTRLTSANTFTFSGIMMKIMSFLMPGAFKKQTKKYLDQFKAFAEGQG